MVDLNVVALDNHGQPVVDLTRDEFPFACPIPGSRRQSPSFVTATNNSGQPPRWRQTKLPTVAEPISRAPH